MLSGVEDAGVNPYTNMLNSFGWRTDSMKTFALIIFLAVAALFCGCDEQSSGSGGTKPNLNAMGSKSSPSKTTGTKRTKSATSSVINYGTGSTQLRVKQTQTKKIQDIQNKYNKKLNDAMK